MPRIRRVKVDASDEQDLLTGLIVSSEFCGRVLHMLRPDHLKGIGARNILEWVADHYDRHGKALGKGIQAVFNVERRGLVDNESESIAELLATLSGKFDQNGNYNWEYETDKARAYVRTRGLEILTETVQVLKDRGEIDQAEKAVRDFIVAGVHTSGWVQPLTDQTLQKEALERVDAGLFRFEGALGRMFGWMQRGWLVAFVGPPKRGKTWWLGEVAMQAVVQGLKVAFFSLEMTEEDMTKRFMQMATALPEKEGYVKVPVWDCAKNQSNQCHLRVRTNNVDMPRDESDAPNYDPKSDYGPCTYCKTHKEYIKEYRVASWFGLIKKKHSFENEAIARTHAFAMQYNGGNLRMECFPRFSASVEDLDNSLDHLEATEGWVPDVVLLDYAGILKEGGDGGAGSSADWQVQDETWKKLGRMAGERKVLLFTAAQGNAKAMTARTMKPDQVAGYTGISAHVDLGITLNQVGGEDAEANEREQMIMRLGTLAMRHGAWPSDQMYVLQNLELGLPAMDTWAVSQGYNFAEFD